MYEKPSAAPYATAIVAGVSRVELRTANKGPGARSNLRRARTLTQRSPRVRALIGHCRATYGLAWAACTCRSRRVSDPPTALQAFALTFAPAGTTSVTCVPTRFRPRLFAFVT